MKKSILKYSCAITALLFIASCTSSESGDDVANAVTTNASSGSTGSGDTTSTASGDKVVVDETDKKKVTLNDTTYTFAEDVDATDTKQDTFSTTTNGDKLLIVTTPEGLVETKYVGLAAYVEGSNPIKNNEDSDDDDYEPYKWDKIKSSGIVLNGDLTPTADLPEKASYEGDYWVSFEGYDIDSPDEVDVQYDTSAGRKWSDTQAGFTATADFKTSEITGNVYGDGDDDDDGKVTEFGAITGDISGNTFTGNLIIPESTRDDGRVEPATYIKLTGGFYGPAAEEIGATGYVEEKSIDRDYLFDENGDAVFEDGKHKFVDTEEYNKVSVGLVGTKQ